MDNPTKIQHHTSLALATAPVTINDFTYLVKDKEIHRILKDSSLYVIAKRPSLMFNNLSFAPDYSLKGEIYQTYTGNTVKFSLPLIQDDLLEENQDDLEIGIELEPSFQPTQSMVKSKNELSFISALTISENTPNGKKFLKWITPDDILERHWKGLWKSKIEGDTTSMRTFKVEYIGEAVVQNIWKRLDKHSNIQKMLSREKPFYPGIRVSRELVILFFEVASTDDARVLNFMNETELDSYLSKSDKVENKNIFYDIEKAMINVFNPKYNQVKYINYPKSKNGMQGANFDKWSYSINDPIFLFNNEVKLKAGGLAVKGDFILVNNKQKPRIIKSVAEET